MIQRKSPLIRIIVQHKEISFEDLNLNVNIEGSEDIIPEAPTEEYIELMDDDDDVDIDVNFDEIPLEEFGDDLELNDFNDEH